MSKASGLEPPLKLSKYARRICVCQLCGKSFESSGARKYCSMNCYTHSPQFRAHGRANFEKARGSSFGTTITVECRNCQKEITGLPHKTKKRKFCSRLCYRQYMAGRFDRWIANPQRIALPQAYDEFLSKEELPCLVEGCDWSGKFLSCHMNATHGVPAAEFKRMAGFNSSTGVISSDLWKKFSERERGWLKTKGHNALKGYKPPAKGTATRPHPIRLEGREHLKKSRAMDAAIIVSSVLLCRTCGVPVPQKKYGRRLYCSTKCRSAWYDRPRFDMACSSCGEVFLGTPRQNERSGEGLVVACSPHCRSNLNSHGQSNKELQAAAVLAAGD